ncbi:hypothetical protein HYV74_03510 [Candidatus Uhrbacteria bacterium]|nr:hypothetical protein [Candidatus Uhrbacteria bacterium]
MTTKGTITIIAIPKSAEVEVHIDLPEVPECTRIAARMQAVLACLGAPLEDIQDLPAPRQRQGVSHAMRKRVRGGT